MCIVFWTLDHPDYSLIICSNRDEYLERRTRNAHLHSFKHEAHRDNILSGIDEVGGGTWFGMTRTGKVALLTNITEPPATFKSSRGSLVSSFLLSDSPGSSLQEEIEELYPRDARYAGFNMLLLAPASTATTELQYDASFVTNAGAGGAISSRPLSTIEKAGGGFSNGIDGQGGSEWPKVQHGMRDFQAALQSHSLDALTESEFIDRLFGLLTWKCPAPVTTRSGLRNTVEVAPIPITFESTKFYGTRLSTVVLIRRDGHVTFIERDIWKEVNGKVERMPASSERKFCFQLDTVT
ncbi:NRDE protein-domain-containing protein [Lentinula aff. detonsa]|uniref:NRDE protein-domain-containing protein n=1 Tax=Lentinula aff. detonsa TaxID=2804958 RepID=A0AA38KEL8_9AGAR|nr:NRDE protein-domain-containing protein [Lentinula aff. detonsa]